MGCICGTLCRKGAKTDAVAAVDEEPRKQYSWEMTKANIDPKDFTIEQLKDELVVRKPGTINGQQFIVQDCQDCRILLLDHMNVVTIDDCKNCQIVLGPTRGSVFIRNSENCRLVALCQQFRARDCLKLRVSLLCSTQPSIEFCSGFKFSCIQLNYKGLNEQIAEAQLNPFTNFWYEVYDFTPSQVVHNWTYSKGYTKVFSDIESEELEGLEITEDAESSAVPRVHGTRKCTVRPHTLTPSLTTCNTLGPPSALKPNSHDRVLIFNGKDCEDKAFKCLKILTEQGHHLVRSCRLEKNKIGANLEDILGEGRAASTCGPLVVLHLTGDELPDGVTQQNNLHTSCDHRVISTLFVNNHRTPANGTTVH